MARNAGILERARVAWRVFASGGSARGPFESWWQAGPPMAWRAPDGSALEAANEQTALTIAAVWACVRAIANPLKATPLRLYRRRAGGGSDVVTDHPAADLVARRPNARVSSSVWREMTLGHVLLWGNGYSEIERDRAGRVRGLWPWTPNLVDPRANPDGTVSYHCTPNRSGSVVLEADRMLHFMGLGFDGVRGYSVVSYAGRDLSAGLTLRNYSNRLFAKDARQGGFLEFPGVLSDPARANLRESFMSQARDGSVVVLEEGMKFSAATIPPDDAQFLETRAFNLEEIARWFGVPRPLLGMDETSWGTGIESLYNGFVAFVLVPWAVHIEQELDEKLLSPEEREAGLYFKFSFNALLRGDAAARAAFYASAIQNGYMTRNEVRALEELNPGDGLDSFLQPVNLATVATAPPQPLQPASES